MFDVRAESQPMTYARWTMHIKSAQQTIEQSSSQPTYQSINQANKHGPSLSLATNQPVKSTNQLINESSNQLANQKTPSPATSTIRNMRQHGDRASARSLHKASTKEPSKAWDRTRLRKNILLAIDKSVIAGSNYNSSLLVCLLRTKTAIDQLILVQKTSAVNPYT